MLVEAVRTKSPARARRPRPAAAGHARALSADGEELDVAEICKRVTLSVFRIVPYQVAAVVLWQPDKDAFRVEYGALADEEPVEQPAWAEIEFTGETESAVTLALKQDAPLLIATIATATRASACRSGLRGQAADVDSVLAVPLKRAGHNVGCLVLGAKGATCSKRRAAPFRHSREPHRGQPDERPQARAPRSASTDPLTSLANRQKFREFLTSRARLPSAPSSRSRS